MVELNLASLTPTLVDKRDNSEGERKKNRPFFGRGSVKGGE